MFTSTLRCLMMASGIKEEQKQELKLWTFMSILLAAMAIVEIELKVPLTRVSWRQKYLISDRSPALEYPSFPNAPQSH